jgi:hypothetical protein
MSVNAYFHLINIQFALPVAALCLTVLVFDISTWSESSRELCKLVNIL